MMLGTQHPYSLHQRKNEELGVGRCKLLHLECISNEVPLYSTGNYIQPLGIECTEDNVGTRMCVCVCVCVCVCIHIYVCMYDWVTILHSKNGRNTTTQLYST